MSSPEALAVLTHLRNCLGPMTAETLADKASLTEQACIEALADLASTGPVVVIDVNGEPFYAVEWGVRHPSERPTPKPA